MLPVVGVGASAVAPVLGPAALGYKKGKKMGNSKTGKFFKGTFFILGLLGGILTTPVTVASSVLSGRNKLL